MIKLILTDIDGVLTNGQVYVNERGEEIKIINYKDLDAWNELKKQGYLMGMITGENTLIAEFFNNRFLTDCFIAGRKDKGTVLEELSAQFSLRTDEICYIGDGKSDVEAILCAGLGVCPADAIDSARNSADIVLKTTGGSGCIWELKGILEDYTQDGQDDVKFYQSACREHFDLIRDITSNKELRANVLRAANLLTDSLAKNGQLLICGNGGSAADAQHIATELVSKFYLERKALNAEALTCNTSSLTAIGNDYDFSRIFARQVEAKGKPGDIVMGISTSGKSHNVLEAFKTAKEQHMNTIALVGKESNMVLEQYADVIINVPSTITPRIQEIHIFIGHLLCQYVEARLFASI